MKRKVLQMKKVLACVLAASLMLQGGSITSFAQHNQVAEEQVIDVETQTENGESEGEVTTEVEEETLVEESTKIEENTEPEKVFPELVEESLTETEGEKVEALDEEATVLNDSVSEKVIKETNITRYEGGEFFGLEGTVKKAKVPVDFYVRVYEKYYYDDNDDHIVVSEKLYFSADADTEIVNLPTTFWAEYSADESRRAIDVVAKYTINGKEYNQVIYKDSYYYGVCGLLGNIKFYSIDNVLVDDDKLQVSLGVCKDSYSFNYFIDKTATVDNSTSKMNFKIHMSCAEAQIDDMIISDTMVESWDFDEGVVIQTDSIPDICKNKNITIWYSSTFYELYPKTNEYLAVCENEYDFYDCKHTVFYDCSKSLGTFKELFPDENLRKYVMKQCSISDENADFTDLYLQNLQYTYDEAIPYSKNTIKNLEGIENLEGMLQLCFEYHDIDSLNNIDWSKLANLETIFLAGNNIKEIPDLRACKNLKYVDLSNNRISDKEASTIVSKLPEGCNYWLGQQRTRGASFVTEDVYYSIDGIVPLAIEIGGYKLNQKTKVEWKIDNQTVQLQQYENNDKLFFGFIPDLSEGKHTLNGRITVDGKTVRNLNSCEFEVVCKKALITSKAYVSSQEDFYIDIYSKKDSVIKSVELLDQNGCIAAFGYENYSNDYFGDYFKNVKFYGSFTSDTLKRTSYGFNQYENFVFRANRKYNLRVTFEDGSYELITDKFEVIDKPYISGVTYEKNIDSENFVLELYGKDFDTDKLSFKFKLGSKTLTAKIVESKQMTDKALITFKKVNWDIPSGINEVYVSVVGRNGYDVVCSEDSYYVYIDNRRETLIYNHAKNIFEMSCADSLKGKELKAYLYKNNYSLNEEDELVEEKTFMVNADSDGIVAFNFDKRINDLEGNYYVYVYDDEEFITYNYLHLQKGNNTNDSSDEIFFYGDSYLLYGDDFIYYDFENVAEYTDDIDTKAYSLTLMKGTKKQSVYLAPVFSEDNGKLSISGNIKSKTLGRGNYSLILKYNNKEIYSAPITILANDRFYIQDNYISGYVGKDNNLHIDFRTLKFDEDDRFEVRLSDLQGNEIPNLTTEIESTYHESICLTVKGLDPKNLKRYYNLIITRNNGEEAYNLDGKKYFATNGYEMYIHVNENCDVFSMDENGIFRDFGVLFNYANLPVKLTVYDAFSTRKFIEKDIFEKDLKDGMYYFTENDINKLPDKNSLVDIAIKFSDGSIVSRTERLLMVHPRANIRDVKINYELNGGINSDYNIDVMDSSIYMVYLNEPSREGYIFEGWYTDKECTALVEYIDHNNDTDEVTVYAKWSPITYIVHYDGNGGEVDIKNRYYVYDKTYYIPKGTKVREGYTFVGWNTEPDGSGQAFKDLQKISNLSSVNREVITLYAQWK